MQMDIKFEESNQRINIPFTEVHQATDGGFERGYEQGYEVGYEQSKIDNPDLFQYATCPMFQDAVFPSNYDVVVNIPNFSNITYSSYFYKAIGMRSIKMICDNKDVVWNGTNFCYAQDVEATLELVDLTEFSTKLKTVTNFFARQTKLINVLGSLDLSECTTITNIVLGCVALQEIRFVAETIKNNITFSNSNLLTEESIQSIIGGLADLTGQTSRTVTFHSSIKINLTDEQLLQITSKNWKLG